MNWNKNTFVLQLTDSQKGSEILKKMKSKKSSGPDGISNEKLKCCFPKIELFIATSFNQCTLERTYPANLKTTKVIPLNKRGVKPIPKNQKPISMLNSLRKVFGKLLQRIMMKFYLKNKLLSSDQYGFRPKMSHLMLSIKWLSIWEQKLILNKLKEVAS